MLRVAEASLVMARGTSSTLCAGLREGQLALYIRDAQFYIGRIGRGLSTGITADGALLYSIEIISAWDAIPERACRSLLGRYLNELAEPP